MEKYITHGEAAVGANKSLINLFNPAATPTTRGRIVHLIVGCEATPADHATDFKVGRTTAVGTEDAGFAPVNLDPAGPAGAYDSGVGFSGGEPTYTANKELLQFTVNQRATFQWYAQPGFELVMAATQNHGAGLKASSATGTAVHQACIYFEE